MQVCPELPGEGEVGTQILKLLMEVPRLFLAVAATAVKSVDFRFWFYQENDLLLLLVGCRLGPNKVVLCIYPSFHLLISFLTKR